MDSESLNQKNMMFFLEMLSSACFLLEMVGSHVSTIVPHFPQISESTVRILPKYSKPRFDVGTVWESEKALVP